MPSVKIFSKLIRIKISNRLQLLQYGRIRRDRQTVFMISSLLITIIYMDKLSSINIKHNAVFARKTALRTSIRAENRLVFRVVRVRVLYKRASTPLSERK